ncbi:MAG TPA: PDZ domain-containing protein [Vicinamibacterales bacterium]|nr:PDZ domain-containing protein [Vicinamibacterales bacterium]
MRSRTVTALLFVGVFWATASSAQAPVTYRVSVPEPEHHWLQVEATFPAGGSGPLVINMSRSSPGRYAVHEFSKNIFAFTAYDGAGREIPHAKPTVNQWRIARHDGTVRIVYKIYGDRIDGTYLGIDGTHAHMNMPATLVWAEGLELRPARVTFVPPPGRPWKIASQLFATEDPLTFTAPNLQYLMDSPTEFSDHVMKTFTVKGPDGREGVIRAAIHHAGTEQEAQQYADAAAKIARVQAMIFGELPEFEPGHYTFLADYLPWASGDGMEHRNSTIVTGRSLMQGLGTASHEFFHVWNVERLRPADLEPFNFGDANVSELLWFAEGFTSYYGPLTLARAGLVEFAQTVAGFGRTADAIVNGSGRHVRSPVEMSRHAPFVDAAAAIDRTDFGRSFISYYTYGAGIAFGLDLTLRQRSGNAMTLDDYMRRLWTKYGKAGGKAPGVVARPYTLADLRLTLGEVAGEQKFADDFFARYIEGREAIDYAKLMDQAGLVLRPARAGAGWIGDVATAAEAEGLRVSSLVPFGTPAYAAGIDQDDLIVAVNGQKPSGALVQLARAMKPGETIKLTVRSRDGKETVRDVTVAPDPHIEVVPVEAAGGTPTAAQQAFRESWLGVR